MSNEMTIALFHSEWGIQNDDYLQHYGILGMHWGIRRYQPYGEGGYDPDHEGKNIGLAARLAGHTGSYSDAIKRGSSFGSRAKAAASSFGKRAGKAASEAVERFNYASDRTAQGLLNAGRKAKSSLAKYASTERINGHSIEDDHYRNLLESSGFGTLAKGVGIQLKADARRGINSIKHTSFDDVKSALGSGASRFQEAMSRTAVKSKEFGRNAAMTAALFGGALDPRSNASQTVQKRAQDSSSPRSNGALMWDYIGTAPGERWHEDYMRWQGKNPDIPNLRVPTASLIRSAGRTLTPDSRTMPIQKRVALSKGNVSVLSPINQKSTAPRWKGNDGMNTEARKRFATGELAELDSRSPVRPRGSTLTGLATKPYKDYNKTYPDDWEFLQERHMDYRDNVKPSRFTRDQLTSKIGNMTTEKFNKELEKRGISFAMINQTPVPMIPKGQNNASIRELEKRLGII